MAAHPPVIVQHGVAPPQLHVRPVLSLQHVFAAGAQMPAPVEMLVQHFPARHAQLPPQPSPPVVPHASGHDGWHTHCPLVASHAYCAPSDAHDVASHSH